MCKNDKKNKKNTANITKKEKFYIIEPDEYLIWQQSFDSEKEAIDFLEKEVNKDDYGSEISFQIVQVTKEFITKQTTTIEQKTTVI